MTWQLNTPVVFIIFKRPGSTEQVFQRIRQAKPPKLLVIADGPRMGRPDEVEACNVTRAITECIDWDCEVLRNYSEANLGCGKRVSSGLNWIFDLVEEAIILEDDCVPHPSFFRFCEELLEYYRHDQRVVAITGQNVQFGRSRTDYSYYFSRYTQCWGWATWRRAWRHYDFDMNLWPEIRDKDILRDIFSDSRAVRIWTNVFQSMYEKKRDTWDYQWTFCGMIRNGLTAISDVNLVANVGYDSEGTHTDDRDSPYSKLAVESVSFPLKHPPYVVRNSQADEFTQGSLYNYEHGLLKRVRKKLRKAIGKLKEVLG